MWYTNPHIVTYLNKDLAPADDDLWQKYDLTAVV